jgi:hypothetical protein
MLTLDLYHNESRLTLRVDNDKAYNNWRIKQFICLQNKLSSFVVRNVIGLLRLIKATSYILHVQPRNLKKVT